MKGTWMQLHWVPCDSQPHKGSRISNFNSKTVPVLPFLDPSLIFPFHLLSSPVRSTGFFFCFFPGFLVIIILSSSNNNMNFSWVWHNCILKLCTVWSWESTRIILIIHIFSVQIVDSLTTIEESIRFKLAIILNIFSTATVNREDTLINILSEKRQGWIWPWNLCELVATFSQAFIKW